MWRMALMALVVAAAPQAAAERACCDLLIFQPADDQSESYAVQVRGTGRTLVATVHRRGPPRLTLDDAEARAMVRLWNAASHKPDTTSVLIDAQTSRFRIGAFPGREEDEDAEPNDPESKPGDTLVLIQAATPAKTRAFIDDIDALTPAMKQEMKAVLRPPEG